MTAKTKPTRPAAAAAPQVAGRMPDHMVKAFQPLQWRVKTQDARNYELLLLAIETAVDELGIDLERMLAIASHPLFPVLCSAIEQATHGKGERHGGNETPFLLQPWAHYARLHGRGFLTGQAAKKLEEAAHQRQGDAYVQETRGAIVYAAMSILHEQGATRTSEAQA